MMYGGACVDEDIVLRYMLDQEIGIHEVKIHIALAFFLEKYHRDF